MFHGEALCDLGDGSLVSFGEVYIAPFTADTNGVRNLDFVEAWTNLLEAGVLPSGVKKTVIESRDESGLSVQIETRDLWCGLITFLCVKVFSIPDAFKVFMFSSFIPGFLADLLDGRREFDFPVVSDIVLPEP